MPRMFARCGVKKRINSGVKVAENADIIDYVIRQKGHVEIADITNNVSGGPQNEISGDNVTQAAEYPCLPLSALRRRRFPRYDHGNSSGIRRQIILSFGRRPFIITQSRVQARNRCLQFYASDRCMSQNRCHLSALQANDPIDADVTEYHETAGQVIAKYHYSQGKGTIAPDGEVTVARFVNAHMYSVVEERRKPDHQHAAPVIDWIYFVSNCNFNS